jgi:transposase
LHLTEGQVHDVTQAKLLLSDVHDCEVIADKGYDADAIVTQAQEQGCIVVIPCRSNRKSQRPFDRVRYKTRHLVENFFQRIKRARRIAMRFEKLAAHYLAMVQLRAIVTWL